MFHLRALQCFANRCHACTIGVSMAVVVEDDAEFVSGVSPGGDAALFPRLVSAAAAQALAVAGHGGAQFTHAHVPSL